MSRKGKKEEQEVTMTEKVEGKVSSFLSNNRKLLLIVLLVIIAAIIAGVAITAHNEKVAEDRFATLNQLESDYTEYLVMEDGSEKEAKLAEITDGLTALSETKGYPAAKSQLTLSKLAFENGEYQKALDGFYQVYETNKENYLGPLALTNCAVAAEELGDDSLALKYYTQVWDVYGIDAPEAPKALFNQARLQNEAGHTDLAKAGYQQLIDQFPSSEYAKLAKSLIVSL